MGKSIRSKSKRSNRTQLRKTFSDPIVNSRAEKIYKKIAEDTAQQNGQTIIGLRSVLQGSKKADAMEDEEVDEEDEEERKLALPAPFEQNLPQFAVSPFNHLSSAQKKQTPAVKVTERLREKAIAKAAAAAAKPKSTKKLEWFK